MKITFKKRLFAKTGAAACVLAVTTATSLGVSAAAGDTSVDLSFRYRLETVDMDNALEDATASTVRTRATIKTKWTSKIDSVLEFDDVSAIGDEDYNAGQGFNTQYAAVIDPTGTEANQAFVRYNGENTKVAFGRQRILVGNQRFVGGVGWRQNEQTYDSFTTRSKFSDKLNFDYSYVFNVNRIFGEAVTSGDHKHNTHLITADYKLESGKLSGYYFAIDNEDAAGLSNNTFGVSYSAVTGQFAYNLEFASQTEAGDNVNDYSATYTLLEATYNKDNYSFGAGYEVLGGDSNGGQGFTTSLATLHKFQGWADVFLSTPSAGITDFNINASFKVGGVNIKAIYHDFATDEASDNLGTELDIAVSKTLTKKLTGLFKYASFDSDHTSYVSRDKIWFMLTYKL
jgi:hypothetical protein